MVPAERRKKNLMSGQYCVFKWKYSIQCRCGWKYDNNLLSSVVSVCTWKYTREWKCDDIFLPSVVSVCTWKYDKPPFVISICFLNLQLTKQFLILILNSQNCENLQKIEIKSQTNNMNRQCLTFSMKLCNLIWNLTLIKQFAR